MIRYPGLQTVAPWTAYLACEYAITHPSPQFDKVCEIARAELRGEGQDPRSISHCWMKFVKCWARYGTLWEEKSGTELRMAKLLGGERMGEK